jgi:large subunit ribosomal protein L9
LRAGIFEGLEVRMKVILIEDIPSLGKAGDIVQVAEGYGRNFLVPKKFALEALPANLRKLEQQRESFLSKATKEKQNAAELAARIEELPCTLARPAGESEKLFGSVTAMDLQKFLQEQGISLDRRKIHLANPIKAIGSYSIPIKLHPDVTAQLKVNVVADSPSRKEQA